MAEKDEDILKEIKDNLKVAMQDEGDNRKMAKEDLEFLVVEGKQWPDTIRNDREANAQPCLTINKLPSFIAQVVGDQRMNRPSIKVIPVDSKADMNVARILGGWIKHVQQISRCDVAIDHGFEHAVSCGYGAMRVTTNYASDTGFEQEAYIEKIDNALAVYFGPHSLYDCSDADYCFVVSDITVEEYKKTYGKNPVSFKEGESGFVDGWSTKDTVRVVEYFVKKPVTKTIYLLEDGTTTDKLDKEVKALKQREVKTYKIKWYLASGDSILKKGDWVGKKYIPIIPIWGREVNVAGKKYIISLIRYAKDPQRMYNYWVSCDTEVVALQPKTPYLATEKQIDGHEAQWKNSHKQSFPYLLVNVDKEAPGWPQRQTPPQASSAMAQRIQMTDQEMRDVVGLQRASLGMSSNERSGVAIRERKQEGDVGTFSFIDNLSRSMEHLGRILVDIAPELLDTDRIVRLGLENNEFEFDAVNVETEGGKILNDLKVGTYDTVVTVGPSFTTQRTEARSSIKEFIQYYPNAAPLIGDIYARVMDWPGADEVSKRLEYLLPPEIKQRLALERAQKTGKPPEQALQQPPDPNEQMRLQEEQLKLEEMKVKLQIENEKLKGVILKNELMLNSSKEDIKKLMSEIIQENTDAQAQPKVEGQPEATPDTFPVVPLTAASQNGEIPTN